MALTKEQAKKFYDAAVAEGYSDEEIVAELKKRSAAAPSAPAPAAAEPEDPYRVKIKTPLQSMEQNLQGNAGQRFMAGVQRANEGMSNQARRLGNLITGGDGGDYQQREADIRNVFEKHDPTGSGISMADVGKAAGETAALAAVPVRGMLGAAGMGAGAGVLAPTVEGENELDNAIFGAGFGALGQGVGTALGRGRDFFRRMDPSDALEDFTSRQLGATRGGNTAAQYSGITDAVEAERARLAEALSRRYANVEGAATIPVSMQESSRLGQEALSLPEEVMNSLNPGAQRTMAALQRGSTRTSPIVNAQGNPIVEPRNVPFVDVRDTVRALRGAKRGLPYTDAGIARGRQIDNIIDRLDVDLERWGQAGPEMGPGNADILRGARQVDADYAAQVAPFNDKENVLGQLRRGAGDEGAINRLFMGQDKGQALGELLQRVPAAEEPARALYGQKLLTERGDTGMIRQLEGGTTAERLLSPDERAYTTALAANVRENKSHGAVDARRILQSLLRSPVGEMVGGRMLDRGLTGVLPYGAQPTDTSLIAKYLRAFGAAESTGE